MIRSLMLAAACVLLSHPAPRAEEGAYSVDRQYRIFTRDRHLYDTVALERVAERLGAYRFRRVFADPAAPPEYRLNAGLEKNYTFQLALDSTLAPGEAEGWLYRVRLDAATYRNEEGLGPSEAFLRFAYLEEVLPHREPAHGERYLGLEPKSRSLFWKKNLIFAGSAVAYVREGNPFSPELTPLWPAFWDALGYTAIAYGTLAGEGSALFSGLLISGMAKFLGAAGKTGHLENYNRIVTSGYRIPARVAADSLRRERPAVARSRAMRLPPKDAGPPPLFKEPAARPPPTTAADRAFMALMGPSVGILGGFLYGSLVHGPGSASAREAIVTGFAGGTLLGLTFAMSM